MCMGFIHILTYRAVTIYKIIVVVQDPYRQAPIRVLVSERIVLTYFPAVHDTNMDLLFVSYGINLLWVG